MELEMQQALSPVLDSLCMFREVKVRFFDIIENPGNCVGIPEFLIYISYNKSRMNLKNFQNYKFNWQCGCSWFLAHKLIPIVVENKPRTNVITLALGNVSLL